MPGFDWLPLSVINANTGTVTLPFWGADVITALLVVLALLAVYRAGFAAVMWTVLRIVLVGITVVAAWALLGRLAERDRADERRGLEQRMQELAARATVPGSVLGCLDMTASEDFNRFCERAIFASAESVAAAADYVAAKLALLADAADYADHGDPTYATTTAGFRRTLEADRFGLLAHVLATREGCTPDKCNRLKLLSDAAQVSAHLREASFDGLVARYSAGWLQGVKSTPDSTPPQASTPPNGQRVGITYPSSASIPPVSIMTSEPSEPGPEAHPAAPAPKRTAATPGSQHHVPRDGHARPPASSPAGAPAEPTPQAAPAQSSQPPSQ